MNKSIASFPQKLLAAAVALALAGPASAVTYMYRVPARGLVGSSSFLIPQGSSSSIRVSLIGNHGEGFNQIAATPDGGWIAVGTSNESKSGGELTVKYNSAGVAQWAQELGAVPSYAVNDTPTVAAGPDGSSFVETTYQYNGYLGMTALTKYSPTGSVLWQRKMGNGNIVHHAGAADASGNYYGVANYTYNGMTYLVVNKFDSAGTAQWLNLYKGTAYARPGYSPIAATADSAGNVYITGMIFPNGSENGAFILKLDTNGNVVWQQRLGNYDASLTYLALDPAGFLYGAGSYNGGLYVVKYDGNGTLVWQRQLAPGSGTAQAWGLTFDASNNDNVFVSGNLSPPSGGCCAPVPSKPVTAALSSTGSLLWQTVITGSDDQTAVGIRLGASAQLYISGTDWTSHQAVQAVIPADGTGLGPATPFNYVQGTLSLSTPAVPSVPLGVAIDANPGLTSSAFSEPSNSTVLPQTDYPLPTP